MIELLILFTGTFVVFLAMFFTFDHGERRYLDDGTRTGAVNGLGFGLMVLIGVVVLLVAAVLVATETGYI